MTYALCCYNVTVARRRDMTPDQIWLRAAVLEAKRAKRAAEHARADQTGLAAIGWARLEQEGIR